MRIDFLCFSIIAFCAEGFLVHVKPIPELARLVDSQDGRHLELGLTIEKGSKNTDRPLSMSIQGLKLTLTTEKSNKTRLPGANGPSPQLSSGVHVAHIDEQPFYVNLDGQQTVELEDVCWEIVWKDTSPHGYLFCGLQVPPKVCISYMC